MIICVRHLRAEFGIDLADPTQLIALGVMSIGNFWKFIAKKSIFLTSQRFGHLRLEKFSLVTRHNRTKFAQDP